MEEGGQAVGPFLGASEDALHAPKPQLLSSRTGVDIALLWALHIPPPNKNWALCGLGTLLSAEGTAVGKTAKGLARQTPGKLRGRVYGVVISELDISL